jgi:integrase
MLHANEADYRSWVNEFVPHPAARLERMRAYRRFVEGWPTLSDWFAEPLTVRLGFVDEHLNNVGRGRSYEAVGYLVYLSLVCGVPLDYDLLLGRKYANTFTDQSGGRGLGVDREKIRSHVARLVELGYRQRTASGALTWGIGRLLLHRGDPNIDAITYDDLRELADAVRAFGARDDFVDLRRLLYQRHPGQLAGGGGLFIRTHLNNVHATHVLLFNIGQVAQLPTSGTRPRSDWRDHLLPEPCPPAIRAVVERYLRLRLEAKFDRPQTIHLAREGLRRFVNWLSEHRPEITNLADLDRPIVEEYLKWMPTCTSKLTGKPLALTTLKHEINVVGAFCRDTAAWGWQDVPGRSLIVPRDSPRRPEAVPRYLPRHELDTLMAAVENLTDPYQRAALLVARWSGARRDEIRRLTIDCLDTYPDGHPRLRIPIGKGHTERVVPLHPSATAALQQVIEIAKSQGARARHDTSAGRDVRHVFVRRGKLLSAEFLFGMSLDEACKAAGLVDETGSPTVSAHRFRHTVGTELAEGGAKIQTIMAILGHRSATMSLIYSHISDPEIRRQYDQALAAGGRIAGPAAEVIRRHELDEETVHWLETNFLKTELELGHCLRLPAEGPCECDLILACSKFVTSSEYAPRLRARLVTEQTLVDDARQRGWAREVERHQATIRRIQELLTELDEPLHEHEQIAGAAS